MKSINQINEAFNKKSMTIWDISTIDQKQIKSFYTKEIMGLIEEMEGKMPKPMEKDRQMGRTYKTWNKVVDQMRASIKSYKKEL